MRISDWSSDVCSSDLDLAARGRGFPQYPERRRHGGGIGVIAFVDQQRRLPADRYATPRATARQPLQIGKRETRRRQIPAQRIDGGDDGKRVVHPVRARHADGERSEEHTSELQSLMRISYAVFCLT